jgi:hypothetical protein
MGKKYTEVNTEMRYKYWEDVGEMATDHRILSWFNNEFAILKNANTGELTDITIPVDKQIGGSHYDLPIQPIDYILKNSLGYCEANVIKYVSRHQNKNGAEDIKKAIHYLELLLKDQYDTNTPEG